MKTPIVLARFRHMLVATGIKPASVSDDELMKMVRGESFSEKLESLEKVMSLTPESYWEKIGL